MSDFRKKNRGPNIYPALLFLDLADLPTVAELLRERLRQTESAMAKTRAIKEQLGAVSAAVTPISWITSFKFANSIADRCGDC